MEEILKQIEIIEAMHLDTRTECFMQLQQVKKLKNLLQSEVKNCNILAVSGSLHLPTKEEIIQTLYKCAKIEKTNEGIKMERIFEKESEAILSLITGNNH